LLKSDRGGRGLGSIFSQSKPPFSESRFGDIILFAESLNAQARTFKSFHNLCPLAGRLSRAMWLHVFDFLIYRKSEHCSFKSQWQHGAHGSLTQRFKGLDVFQR
jgi:hypothetical protein